MAMKSNLLLVFFISLQLCSVSQFVLDTTLVVATGAHINNGSGISTFDFNQDGWDDITYCNFNQSIRLYQNNQQGGFFLLESIPNNADSKHPVWVDYDNDGDYDLFITKYHASCKLYRNDGDLTNMIDQTEALDLPASSANTFGCSWADYDQDGFLDVYLCNWMDDTDTINTNWLLHNNGDGTFTDVTSATGTGNGVQSTFQSIWIDIDNNGRLDLYVVNDHNQPNALYLNFEDGFVESAVSTGLNLMMNSMCSTMADYDQDGDFDVYVSNGFAGNKLMRNDALEFTNVAVVTGTAVNAQCWNSSFLDVENDGDDDLHVCVAEFVTANPVHINMGNGYYYVEEIAMQNGQNLSFCASRGDFNNDGYMDFACYNAMPLGIEVWQNNYSQENNWIKLHLNALSGDADPYGAVIKCYENGTCITSALFCGDNYLSQDSEYRIVGLGNALQADSVVVHWPGGWIDRYYNLQANQQHELNKGQSFFIDQNSIQPIVLCVGDTISISPEVEGDYLWQNETTEETLAVTAGGVYTVTINNQFGLSQTLEYIVNEVLPVAVNSVASDALCHGAADGSIHIYMDVSSIDVITWNGGSIETSTPTYLDNLPAGEYNYHLVDINGCAQEGNLTISEPDEITVNWNTTQVCVGSTTPCIYETYGGVPPFQYNWNGSNADSLSAGQHQLTVTDANQCDTTVSVSVNSNPEILLECNVPLACNGGVVAAQILATGGVGVITSIIDGFDPSQLEAGVYQVVAIDEAGCTAMTLLQVEEAEALEITAQVTNAFDGSNGAINIDVSGGVAPYSFDWSCGDETEDLTAVGQGVYTCSVIDAMMCSASEIIEVLDLHIGEAQISVSTYPNPFTKELILEFEEPCPFTITNAAAELVYVNDVPVKKIVIDTDLWCTGIYKLHASWGSITLIKL
ncbi:MAG: FG-GAP-like repeat-containing protein [Flavobacteriales bacterium]